MEGEVWGRLRRVPFAILLSVLREEGRGPAGCLGGDAAGIVHLGSPFRFGVGADFPGYPALLVALVRKLSMVRWPTDEGRESG